MYENLYIIFINVNILLIRVWPDRIFICTSFLNREKDEKQRLRKGEEKVYEKKIKTSYGFSSCRFYDGIKSRSRKQCCSRGGGV